MRARDAPARFAHGLIEALRLWDSRAPPPQGDLDESRVAGS